MRRVFGGLALGVVKISRHRDHGAKEIGTKRVFSAVTHRRQNIGADFDRRFFTLHGLEPEHARMIDKTIVRLVMPDHILQAAAHEALDRDDRVFRITRQRGLGFKTDMTPAALEVAHHRRQYDATLVVRQAFGDAMAHGSHQGMGGTQVNAHHHAPLVRIGGVAGF